MKDRFDRITPGLPAKLGLFTDAALVCVALFLVRPQPVEVLWGPLLPVVILGWFLAAAILRLYSPCTPRTEWDSLLLGALGAAGVTIGLAVVGFLVGQPLARVALVDFALMVFAATTFTRLALSGPFWRLREPKDRILIVGTGGLGLATYERLTAAGQRSAIVVGFLRLPGEPASVPVDAPVLGSHDDLLEALTRGAIDEVYVAGRIIVHGEAIQQLVRTCEEVGTPFALPLHSMSFERATLIASSSTRDGYLHYLNTRRSPMECALKRLIDITLAGTALMVLALPLLAVAIGIKLTSRGPVFFRQPRVGLHGATFSFLKFRTMVVNAEALRAALIAENKQAQKRHKGATNKMTYDPRITRVGRFMRKYSIDELPQLVNVLRGDMSIVGPRPALPEEVVSYKPWQRRRLSVRPGLTCFWQVTSTGAERNFDEWMRQDLRYVDDWSLGVDLTLIAQTLPVVLHGRAASNEFYVWRGQKTQ